MPLLSLWLIYYVSVLPLDKGPALLFFSEKGQIVNILGFLVCLCHSYSAVSLSHVSSLREYINERVWLYSSKTSFMDTEVEISDNFHVS